MAPIVRKKVHKKPTNRAIYRPNLDFECGILRGKEKAHLKSISFFSHLAGGWGSPGRPVFWLGGMLEKQSKCQRRDISAEKSEKVSINWWQIGKNQCKIYIKNANQFCVDFLTEK